MDENVADFLANIASVCTALGFDEGSVCAARHVWLWLERRKEKKGFAFVWIYIYIYILDDGRGNVMCKQNVMVGFGLSSSSRVDRIKNRLGGFGFEEVIGRKRLEMYDWGQREVFSFTLI